MRPTPDDLTFARDVEVAYAPVPPTLEAGCAQRVIVRPTTWGVLRSIELTTSAPDIVSVRRDPRCPEGHAACFVVMGRAPGTAALGARAITSARHYFAADARLVQVSVGSPPTCQAPGRD